MKMYSICLYNVFTKSLFANEFCSFGRNDVCINNPLTVEWCVVIILLVKGRRLCAVRHGSESRRRSDPWDWGESAQMNVFCLGSSWKLYP